jgi:hypothetical protein
MLVAIYNSQTKLSIGDIISTSLEGIVDVENKEWLNLYTVYYKRSILNILIDYDIDTTPLNSIMNNPYAIDFIYKVQELICLEAYKYLDDLNKLLNCLYCYYKVSKSTLYDYLVNNGAKPVEIESVYYITSNVIDKEAIEDNLLVALEKAVNKRFTVLQKYEILDIIYDMFKNNRSKTVILNKIKALSNVQDEGFKSKTD